MKSYEEMAQSVFFRSHALMQKRKKRIKIFLYALPCFAVILCLGIWLWSQFARPRANYGTVKMLPPEYVTVGQVHGLPSIGSDGGSGGSGDPPAFMFGRGQLEVVAKAVAVQPGIYQSLPEYGYAGTQEYRLYQMEVLDPLESDLEGGFWYLFPTYLVGDLTDYNQLLLAMDQAPAGYALRCDDQLIAFDQVFFTTQPELGDVIAFTDGIFDESLWKDQSWLYGYQFARQYLEEGGGDLLVYRGSTLEEALEKRSTRSGQIYRYDFTSAAAQEALAYMDESGVFIPRRSHGKAHSSSYIAHRYINGCPTNERVLIDYDTGEVTYENRFTQKDLERLPDVAGYIESLDLAAIEPQHMDPDGKRLLSQSAAGWYEKTDTGVYAIVRIRWCYLDNETYETYYDETFILLEEAGDRLITRTALKTLIGESNYIYDREYGEGEHIFE